MCLSAIYWARIDKIVYGNTREDAKHIDFDDSFIYDEVAKSPNERSIRMTQASRDTTIATFNEWKAKSDKVAY
jgi:tRNA(Arg) A34 adenosine deaminase TadA